MLRRKNDQLNKGELARVATTTMWWAHNGGTHWNLRTQHVHICQVWNHGPPSARTPIDVEWRKRCAQNDEQPIQGSLTRGNQSVQQIFKAPLVQSACAIILGVHAIVQSLMLDIKGEWWKQRRGYLGVPTILGIETPICFVKQLVVAHVPSPRLHGSCCQSLEFVAPDVVLHLCLVMHMDTPMGWWQQCSISYVRGVLRMFERRIHGNKITVQETYVCEPHYPGHMCIDLDGGACFGKLHLFVVWERPLWCGLWGFILSSNRSCWWLWIIVRHRRKSIG